MPWQVCEEGPPLAPSVFGLGDAEYTAVAENPDIVRTPRLAFCAEEPGRKHISRSRSFFRRSARSKPGASAPLPGGSAGSDSMIHGIGLFRQLRKPDVIMGDLIWFPRHGSSRPHERERGERLPAAGAQGAQTDNLPDMGIRPSSSKV